MSRAEAASAMDRLPWLPDEPQPPRARRRSGTLLGWAAAAIAVVAGAGFWMGTRSVQDQPVAPAHRSQPATTVQLPEARPATPQVHLPVQPQVAPITAPQVQPAPAREVKIAIPPAERTTVNEVVTTTHEEKVAEQAARSPEPRVGATAVQPKSSYVIPRPWPARVTAGAAGRLVQIGAFGSTHQAKLGWRYMVRAYPAVAHLPAVVRPARNSNGRTFYRFQIGTTSQAHSEVLCQRMQAIHFSCAVVGLPWKSKVER